MSLKHAILVLLEREPGSGYDLSQRFAKGIGNFWQASHQQIYQQLKALNSAGLVSHCTQEQAGKPDRKEYQITAQGKAALSQWMNQPEKSPVVRDGVLIKVFAAHLADRESLVSELSRHLSAHREKLASHRQAEAAYFALANPRRAKLRLPYLTLRRGIRYEQDWIAWLEETRDIIANDRVPDAPVPE